MSLPGALHFELPRVEGALLACLCSSHPEVGPCVLGQAPKLFRAAACQRRARSD